VFKDRLDWLADDHEVEIPVDRENADVLCTMSSIEIMKYPDSVVATARIMNHLGVDWTFRLDGYEATNFGLLAGNTAAQKQLTMKIIDAAVACGAKTVILPSAATPTRRCAGWVPTCTASPCLSRCSTSRSSSRSRCARASSG